jgi:hypothetical protein
MAIISVRDLVKEKTKMKITEQRGYIVFDGEISPLIKQVIVLLKENAVSREEEALEITKSMVSGYMKNGDASRVYVLDEKGKVLVHTELKDGDKDYVGHCGGITHDGEYVYISNDDNDAMSLDVFKLSDILDGGDAKKQGSVYVYQKPAFCYVIDGKLYTGNFHREETRGSDKEYLSPDKVAALGDDMSTALMTVFELDHTKYASNFGVATEPCEAFSIPSQVQGMCYTKEGNVVFSTSWGVSISKLYMYNLNVVKSNSQTKTTTDLFKDTELFDEHAIDKEIPLYVMGEADLFRTVKATPMAEEMVYLDGKVYIMNESASNKYIFGRFLSGAYVSAFKVN